MVLDTLPAAEKGRSIKIHRFTPDVDGIVPAWKDWLIILLSSAKITVAVSLWSLGSSRLWLWSMVGWAHAFISAIVLQLCGFGRDSPLKCNRDLIAGVLPSALHLGRDGKIVLGAPANVRRHPLWRIALGLGTFLNLAGMIGIFMILENEPPAAVYVWIGFQALWLLSRTIIFYLVEAGGAVRQGTPNPVSWEDASAEDRLRAMTLLEGLSKHQVSIHPRGFAAYLDDCLSPEELSYLLADANWTLTTSIAGKLTTGDVQCLDIRAVTGDPLIRSLIWFSGVPIENLELYDACIAFMGEKDTIAVPCVRVYACDCMRDGTRERGNSHPPCGRLEWVYFIPCSMENDCSWVCAHSSCSVGKLETECLTAEDLNRRLSMEWWKISLQSVQEMRVALEACQNAAAVVRDLLHVTR
jgi:hypothetical protein